jgi:hypothetical protein
VAGLVWVLAVAGVCSLVLAAVWLIGHAPLDAVLVTVFQLDTAAAGTSQRIAVFFRHAREGAVEQDRIRAAAWAAVVWAVGAARWNIQLESIAGRECSRNRR